MKKIIISTIVLISIPFFVVFFYDDNNVYKEELINLKYVSSIIVRVKRVNKDRIDNVMLEDYVVGAVAGEMPVSFEIEALKAQAVVSRSYVLRKINDNKDGSYDVVDTTSNQVYLDLDDLKDSWGNNFVNYLNKIRDAVNSTSMEYLEYNGDIANTMFFSTSNGYTEDCSVFFSSDVPYLRSVPSSWDSSVNSNFNYSKKISLRDFYNNLGLDYNSKLNIEILERSSSKRITNIKINGVKFSGKDIYNKLGIRSTDFSIIQDGDDVIINTKGYGHGVGMSQYGAYGMAKDGYNYKEILNHYYKGTNLKKIKN
ncbi:MAG: stage II sporulation protein D [Bacilli bacterium]|nr:stage II sporulation protein D [Bacilli bacterium]